MLLTAMCLALAACSGGGGGSAPETGGGEMTPETGGGDMTPETGGGDMTPEGGGEMTPETGGGDMTPEATYVPIPKITSLESINPHTFNCIQHFKATEENNDCGVYEVDEDAVWSATSHAATVAAYKALEPEPVMPSSSETTATTGQGDRDALAALKAVLADGYDYGTWIGNHGEAVEALGTTLPAANEILSDYSAPSGVIIEYTGDAEGYADDGTHLSRFDAKVEIASGEDNGEEFTTGIVDQFDWGDAYNGRWDDLDSVYLNNDGGTTATAKGQGNTEAATGKWVFEAYRSAGSGDPDGFLGAFNLEDGADSLTGGFNADTKEAGE